MLAVDDALHAVPAADDKWSEIVIVVVRDGFARIAFLINVKECRSQVCDKLLDVLLLPTVFALEVINGVFSLVQDLGDVAVFGIDFVVVFAHGGFLKVLQ